MRFCAFIESDELIDVMIDPRVDPVKFLFANKSSNMKPFPKDKSSFALIESLVSSSASEVQPTFSLLEIGPLF